MVINGLTEVLNNLFLQKMSVEERELPIGGSDVEELVAL